MKQVLKENVVNLVKQDQVDLEEVLEDQDLQDQEENLVCKVELVREGHQAQKDLLDHQVKWDQMADLDRQDQEDHQGKEDFLDLMEVQDQLDPMDNLVCKELVVNLDLMECLAQQDKMENVDHLENQGHLVNEDRLDH